MATDPASFEALWEQAWNTYLASTSRTPAEVAVLQNLQSVEDLSKQIETHAGKFSSFRSKHEKLFKALSAVVQPFQFLSSVATTALSVTPCAPASAVLGAVNFLIEAANGVSEAYDWIEELFTKLAGFAERLEEYVKTRMKETLRKRVVAILVCLLEILARAEKLMKQGRLKKYAATLFLGKDEKVQASFQQLQELFEGEELLVLAIVYATNQRIEKAVGVIDDTTKKTLQKAEVLETKLNTVVASIDGKI